MKEKALEPGMLRGSRSGHAGAGQEPPMPRRGRGGGIDFGDSEAFVGLGAFGGLAGCWFMIFWNSAVLADSGTGWNASKIADLRTDGIQNIGAILPAESDSASVGELRAAPSLVGVRDGGTLSLTFSGVLLSSANLDGPWTPVAGAVSPYQVNMLSPARYFRSRESDDGDVFGSKAILSLGLSGPFQPNFDRAFAGLPDGIFPPVRVKDRFPGRVVIGRFDVPATLRVRGNSSLQECPFPKLKMNVAREDRKGTPFEKASEVKIGTHCADGGTGTVGRLRDETATYREVLAYEVMDALGFVTPRVRRARIEYTDTSVGDEEAGGGWRVERQAMLLEDPEVLAGRLGGRALSGEEIAALKDVTLDGQTLADLRLLHALLGNWDYALPENGQGLWNTDVLAMSDGSLVLVAGDFDLSSWVTGVVRLGAPHDYRPELPELERQMRFEVGQVRKRVGEARFGSARDRFRARRAALEALVQGAELDAPGRGNELGHLTVFYKALDDEA